METLKGLENNQMTRRFATLLNTLENVIEELDAGGNEFYNQQCLLTAMESKPFDAEVVESALVLLTAMAKQC